MKIIRWLLSHLFLILLIVAVIYGYMFWGNLAGEDTPAGKALAYLSDEFVEVEEFISAVKAKQAKLSAEQQRPAESEQSDSDTSVAAKANIAQQPVSISYSHNQMRVKQNSAGDIESQAERVPPASVAMAGPQPKRAEKPVMANRQQAAVPEDVPPQTAAVASTPDKFVSTRVERELANVDSHGEVIDKSLQGDAIRESWITARKSFYQRKYELSEQSYRDVIDNTTDNFDAYGELGNVYFNQGKKEAAAMAYFEAASILVRKGEIRRARSLMGLLRHLDKNQADNLQKLIDSTVS